MDLYETTPGAMVRGIAEDLGITRGALRQWLALHDTGRKTGADGAPDPLENPAEAIARLEAEHRALRAQAVKLTAEGEILRQAAKSFARGDEPVNRFQSVEDHKSAGSVKRVRQLIGIARS